MRKPFVAGNWKMHGSKASAGALIEGVVSGATAMSGVQVVLCPPYVFLPQAVLALKGSVVEIGAQDVCDQDAGAYTGEVSGAMLIEQGCRHVIVGHSERRHIYGESDALTAKKFAAARRAGLNPIVCVGETLDERNAGSTELVIARQLDAVAECADHEALANAVIAYEPVWAIGTGHTASPNQAQEVHAFIRQRWSRRIPGGTPGLRIIYGGSVKPENARALFAMPDIDGGLIGGASLDAAAFLAICRAA